MVLLRLKAIFTLVCLKKNCDFPHLGVAVREIRPFCVVFNACVLVWWGCFVLNLLF